MSPATARGHWRLALLGSQVLALVAFAGSVSGQDCICDVSVPACQPLPSPKDDGGETCVKIARNDCPCCMVCAGQLGQPCSGSNAPCDVTNHLVCDQDTRRCKKDSVPCKHNGVWYEPGQKFKSPDCSEECLCTAHGEVHCHAATCEKPLFRKGEMTDDPLCSEEPLEGSDDDCCVAVFCSTESEDEDYYSTEYDTSEDTPAVTSGGTSSGQEDFRTSGDADRPPIKKLERDEQSGRPIVGNADQGGVGEFLKSELHIPKPEAEAKSDLWVDHDEDRTLLHLHPRNSNLEILQVTSTSVQVQFPGITGGNLMYIEERLFTNSKGTAAASNSASPDEAPWENAIILEGNEIFTLTGLKPSTPYRLRWQAPDKQYEDVMVSTKEHDEKKPKAIITKTSYGSVTLAFDHFAPDDYSHGYFAMYKRADGRRWTTVEQSPEVKSDLPSITITGLAPNTKYEARVAIYSDYESRSHGKSTGIIQFQTDRGCWYNNASYAVGTFQIGCELTCECDVQGQVECGPRCQPPFHKAGFTAGDPLCVERPVAQTDEGAEGCCVIVDCVSANSAVSSGLAVGSGSGGILDLASPCSGNKCGPNAVCKHEVSGGELSADTICVCKEGYTGDPDSAVGCAEHDPRSSHQGLPHGPGLPDNFKGCVTTGANKRAYRVGEEWFDGCDYRCICSQEGEILCQPRCKSQPPEGATLPGCELKPDPDDQECCKVMHCPSPTSPDGSDGSPSSVIMEAADSHVNLPFDGCLFKNKTYSKDERFYDGCTHQCQCTGFGDMVCVSRCPPLVTPAPGQNCLTLQDVSDPCCNITVCDDPFLDPDQNVKKETEESEDTGLPPPKARILWDAHEHPAPEPIPGTDLKGVKLGDFEGFFHDVSGSVYALNQSSLLVKDFTYDGTGPDAFFWAGTDSEYPSRDGTILPYPFTGKFFDYEDLNAPLLPRSYAWSDKYNPSIVLHLPQTVKVDDLKWLSVWCRAAEANFGHVIFPSIIESSLSPHQSKGKADPCLHDGKVYGIGELFYKGCDELCVCIPAEVPPEGKELACNPIKCPSNFGLDVKNPECLEWDEHKDFVPEAPMCCPPPPVCLNTGSCVYKGVSFNNYDSIPANMSGCEQRCHCDDGQVKCHEACHPISDRAPRYLQCSPEVAVKKPMEERPCCQKWDCPDLGALPDHLEGPVKVSGYNATSLKIEFGQLPKNLNGRSGFYQVHYVSGLSGHQDPNKWPHKVIKPSHGMFDIEDNLESSVVLTGLLPNKQYFLRTVIKIRDNEADSGYRVINSDITSGRTKPPPLGPNPVGPQIKRIDIELVYKDVLSKSAHISWRFFSTEEKQFIDGVQIRVLELRNGTAVSGVPRTTPFIHRDTNFFLLEELEPATEYQVDVYLIPVPKAKVEMVSDSVVTFVTAPPKQDKYNFKIVLDTTSFGSTDVALVWRGVPDPHEKFVNVYRILYTEELGPNAVETNQPMSIFKLAKTNSARIGYLTPNTKYQFWMEAYLTNGKVKTSNVLEVRTARLDSQIGGSDNRLPPSPIIGDDHHNSDDSDHSGDDHTPMGTIVASTVAALAVIGLIIVTALYLKRTTTYKAIISGGKQKNSSELPVSNNDFIKRPSAKTHQAPSVPNGNGNSMEMNGLRGGGVLSSPAAPPNGYRQPNGTGNGRINEGACLDDRGPAPPPPPVQPRPPPR